MGVYRVKKQQKWSSRDYEKERVKLFKQQKGCCAICNKPQSQFKRRLNLDHNHATGQIRGLLCYYCNKFRVGRNDLKMARELVHYLQVEDNHGGI